MNSKRWLIIGLYLISIITANLLVSAYGTKIVIPVAFFLIGLDITTRDYLHDAWKERRWLKLGTLIAVGSLLSWLLNRNSATIAIASFVAFASSQIVDTLVYTLLYKHHPLIKMNGSNLFSSLTDSTVFLTIAFGSFMPLLILAQFTAKFVGGFMWSLLIHKLSTKKKLTRES
jgi:large-conductance mechanosensitive channel